MISLCFLRYLCTLFNDSVHQTDKLDTLQEHQRTPCQDLSIYPVVVREFGRTGGAAAGAVITMAPSFQTAFLFGGTCIIAKLPDKVFAATKYVKLHERGSLLTSDQLCWRASHDQNQTAAVSHLIRVSDNLPNLFGVFSRYPVGGHCFLGLFEYHHSDRLCTKPGRDGPSIQCRH